jgi:hypothetical protein
VETDRRNRLCDRFRSVIRAARQEKGCEDQQGKRARAPQTVAVARQIKHISTSPHQVHHPAN